MTNATLRRIVALGFALPLLLAALLCCVVVGCAKHEAPPTVSGSDAMLVDLKMAEPQMSPGNDRYISRLQHKLDHDQNQVNYEQAALAAAKAKRGKLVRLTYAEIDVLTEALSQVILSQGTTAMQCVPTQIELHFTDGDKWQGQSMIDSGVAQHILHELGTDVDICK